jgi:hypothetical protein
MRPLAPEASAGYGLAGQIVRRLSLAGDHAELFHLREDIYDSSCLAIRAPEKRQMKISL